MGKISNFLDEFGKTSKRKKSVYQLRQELENDEIQTSDPTPSTETDDKSLKNSDSFSIENQTGDGKKGFKKCLTVTDLIAFGVGSIIGAGIFVLTGVAAKRDAGPSIVLSYLVAGICCALSGLCYAEFASRIPCSGSTYSYSYIMVGELIAWTVGWDLTLEYMIASASVAKGWSGYLGSIIKSSGGYLPHPLAPIKLATGFSFDLIAFFSVIALSLIVAFGMKESARFNKVFVVIKIAIILFVIVMGSIHADTSNWDDFTPYGTRGIFNAAAITFFAYLGFDGVCNVAEETANPQRDLPIGILGSLGISTVLYIAVAAVLTLMVPYNLIDVDAPLSVAFDNIGLKWASIIVAIGAFAGLTTAQLGGLLSQPRLYYSLSRDGLLPKWFGVIHPRFKTPFNATIFTGVCCATIALFVEIDVLADMVSIGTLLSFTLVSTCVLILRYPPPQSKEESIAKYPVNRFPLFLQSNVTLVPFIIVCASLASLGYVKSLHWSIILVFGFVGILFSAIPFFFKETEKTILNSSKKSFVCPFVPFIPILSIWANMYLMVSLSWGTWVRLIVWLIIGFFIYFFYGRKHSKLGKEMSGKLDGQTDDQLEMEKLKINDQSITKSGGGLSSSSNSNSNSSSGDESISNNEDSVNGRNGLISSGVSEIGGDKRILHDAIIDNNNNNNINRINQEDDERQPLSPKITSTIHSKNSTPKFKSKSSTPILLSKNNNNNNIDDDDFEELDSE